MKEFRVLTLEELTLVTGGDRGYMPPSDALDGEGDALAHADAHGAERKPPPGTVKLLRRGGDEPGA